MSIFYCAKQHNNTISLMKYCPYTDQELNDSDMSPEHIIPLSLGGINGFEIPVCKDINKKLGSRIDAKIGQELIIQSKRTKLKIQGHSGKIPEMYYKNAQDIDTGLPLQIKISKDDGIKLRTPYIPKGGPVPTGKQIQFRIKSDLDIWIKYVAKVALSAGYFSYKEQFRKSVRTEDLRDLIFNKHSDLEKTPLAQRVQGHYFLLEESNETNIYKYVCKLVGDHSCVGIVPSNNHLTFFTGILGEYIGMLRIEADTTDFPNEGDYWWGHVMCPQEGRLNRSSWHRVIEQIVDMNN